MTPEYMVNEYRVTKYEVALGRDYKVSGNTTPLDTVMQTDVVSESKGSLQNSNMVKLGKNSQHGEGVRKNSQSSQVSLGIFFNRRRGVKNFHKVGL